MTPEKTDQSHRDLVVRAEKWLNQFGCTVVLREFCACTPHGEIPDAIGWKSGFSILIECKATRSDFLSDKKKVFREFPEKGMGHVRLYMCPPGIINPDDLPDGWGLLWAGCGKVERKVAPKGNTFFKLEETGMRFFTNRCLKGEVNMLLSVVRRLKIRGHFDEIYEPLPARTHTTQAGDIDFSSFTKDTHEAVSAP